MAARADELSMVENDFEYYANANVFNVNIELPKDVRFESPLLQLRGKSDYQYRIAEPPPKGQGLFSYESGYSQVAGHPSTKVKGYATLATGVLEGLNVLDVLTADRVVGQISTVYPENNSVPSVTFLGTRFENLRIDGHRVDVEQDLNIFGSKPDGDGSYFQDAGVLSRVAQQYDAINGMPDLPAWARPQFNWASATAQSKNLMKCALVNRVSGAPGKSFGHVIDLPHFGRIFLGEIGLKRTDRANDSGYYNYLFHLEMIRLELGCIADGTGHIVTLETNGGGSQGGGGGPKPTRGPVPPPPPSPPVG